MTYKETLFFVAQALTINNEPKNLHFVKEQIASNKVDWDKVVQVSTQHYVFPVLYCNLKKATMLVKLPKDLVAYMEHITQLNRDRNLKIIKQAKEINAVLKAHNIEPIFIKGTSFLLEGLYDDIAERMVGDIDFLVSKKEYLKTISTLKDSGYKKFIDYGYKSRPQFKHYDRLVKDEAIAAVEIHKELTLEGYHHQFNYGAVSKDTFSVDKITMMSYQNQLIMSLLAKQINDYGQFYNDVSLRHGYDVFLLSLKTNAVEAIKRLDKLFTPLNNFLALCQYTFNSKKIVFQKTVSSQKSKTIYKKILNNDLYRHKRHKRIRRKLAVKERVQFIVKSIIRKENRAWIFNRFRDKQWQRQKLIQLGLLKPNSDRV